MILIIKVVTAVMLLKMLTATVSKETVIMVTTMMLLKMSVAATVLSFYNILLIATTMVSQRWK